MLLNLDWGKGCVEFNMFRKIIFLNLTDTLLKDYFFFKSFWANIAQFEVKPLAIVIHFKLIEHLIFGFSLGLNLFIMNRFHF